MNAVQIAQSGLSMGERDYYLAEDEATTKIREAFKAHIVKMMQLAGHDDAAAARIRDIVMDVETRLAKAFRSRVELRDPQANYHKMTLDELKKQYPTFDWDAYLGGFGLKDTKEIIVGQPASLAEAAKILDTLPLGQPASLAEAAKILDTLPLDQQKLYLQWKLVDASASCLSDALNEQNFDFYSRTMSGQKEQQPRWKRAVSTVSGVLGEAVGQMYVEKYFPAAAKERMTALVKNLQTALGERIQALEWMGDSTKVKALEKLSTFRVKIGYPDKWKGLSRQVEGLLRPGHQDGLLLGQHRACQPMGLQGNAGQGRQARGPRGMAHDPADRQRLLQPHHERNLLPRRHPAAALL